MVKAREKAMREPLATTLDSFLAAQERRSTCPRASGLQLMHCQAAQTHRPASNLVLQSAEKAAMCSSVCSPMLPEEACSLIEQVRKVTPDNELPAQDLAAPAAPEKRRERYAKNPDGSKAASLKWKRNNPDRVKASSREIVL